MMKQKDIQMLAFAFERIRDQEKLILSEIAEIKKVLIPACKQYDTVDEMIKDYLEQD